MSDRYSDGSPTKLVDAGLEHSPPTTPMKKYSCSTVLQKEAATRPDPARQPPNRTMGRLPKRFTKMLLMGPEEKQAHYQGRDLLTDRFQGITGGKEAKHKRSG